MSIRDGWDSSGDSKVNIQPNRDNPHDVDQGSVEGVSEADVSQYVSDYNTRDFSDGEVSLEELYSAAAEASKVLSDRYSETGEYLMAEIGSEGVQVIAQGDESEFWIDELYDPMVVEGSNSPLEILDRTGFAAELGFSVIDYFTGHLDAEESYLEDVWPISLEDMERNNHRVVVAPGLEEQYRMKKTDL